MGVACDLRVQRLEFLLVLGVQLGLYAAQAMDDRLLELAQGLQLGVDEGRQCWGRSLDGVARCCLCRLRDQLLKVWRRCWRCWW